MGEKRQIPPGLGLGTWQFGDDPYWPGQKQTDTLKTIDAALRAGIRHFDTAQVYGNGRSEQQLGQRLHHWRKTVEKPFIAGKILPCDPDELSKRLELSCRRLFCTQIDLLYIHWPQPAADLRPFMEALEKQRSIGRIGLIGVSNFSSLQMQELQEAGTIDACQFGHSLLWRTAEEEIVPWCRSHEVATVAYSPLCQGILATGKIPKKNDLRSRLIPMHPRVEQAAGELLAILREESLKPELSMAGIALAWSLSRPFLDATVVGARTREQLETAAAAREINLPEKTVKILDEASETFQKSMKELLGLKPEENMFGHRPGRRRRAEREDD
jgi:myo-inositol catabolism protein IolS